MAKIFNWMGHSGSEPGARGILIEDDVTRDARTIATAYFKRAGHSVTADSDNMSLVQRINASTDRSALIVEWHANVGGGNGTEVWYSQYDKGLGIKIAKAMSAAAAKVGLQNRGAKNSKTNRYGRLGILDDPMPTAVLVELIFLDSKHDTDLWKKNKTSIVETLCKAMLDAAGWHSVAVGGSSSQPVTQAPAKPADKKGIVRARVDGYLVNSKGEKTKHLVKANSAWKVVNIDKHGVLIGSNEYLPFNNSNIKIGVKASDKFKSGSAWKVVSAVMLDGKAYFQLSTTEFVTGEHTA